MPRNPDESFLRHDLAILIMVSLGGVLVMIIVGTIGGASVKRGAHVSFHKGGALWWTNGGLRECQDIRVTSNGFVYYYTLID